MIVVLPVCHKDQDAALRNLRWAKELDEQVPFQCVISCETGFDAAAINEAASAYFSKVTFSRYANYPRYRNQAWPRPQNWAWRQSAIRISQLRDSWLWWEADAVPLKAGWLNRLHQAYIEGGKPFMGATGATQIPDEKPHLAGVAIYPSNWQQICPQSMLYSDALPFDTCGTWRVLQSATITPLIQHVWTWMPNNQGPAPSFQSPGDVSRISSEAVLFHRCKDDSLITSLRLSRQPGSPIRKLRLPKRRMRLRWGKRTVKPIPDLTVVITNFRRPEFLLAAVESCLEADIPRVVISSSGADGEVMTTHSEISKRCPNVMILAETGDSGSNHNWLTGVRAATTEWVQILHDDDRLMPGYPVIFDKLGGYEFICWDAVTHGAVKGETVRTFQGLKFGEHPTVDLLPFLMRQRLSPSPVAGVFRRTHLIQVLEQCEKWGFEFYYRGKLLVGNDLLIWLSTTRIPGKFLYLSDRLCSYGNHPGSATVQSVITRDGKLMDIYNRVREMFKEGRI